MTVNNNGNENKAQIGFSKQNNALIKYKQNFIQDESSLLEFCHYFYC
jgi:hypothetical protein